MWNLFYIHKEESECASILNSVWWIFHAVSCTLLWRKIGLHSYTARPFKGTINYRNHCVFFTPIAVTQISQRNKRKKRRERRKKVWDSPVFLGKVLLSPLGGFIYKLHISCFHPSAQRYQSWLWEQKLGSVASPNVLKMFFRPVERAFFISYGTTVGSFRAKKRFFFFLQRITVSQNTFKYARWSLSTYVMLKYNKKRACFMTLISLFKPARWVSPTRRVLNGTCLLIFNRS